MARQDLFPGNEIQQPRPNIPETELEKTTRTSVVIVLTEKKLETDLSG